MSEATAATQKPGDPQPRPAIALVIGERQWLGWTYADIVATMDAVSGSFSIGVTDRWSGAARPRPIAPGDACRLTIDGEPVIDGSIDVVQPFYDAHEHGVNITGRDRTGDLADCSADDGEWHDIELAALVAAIARPFGIKVYREADTGARFRRFRIQPGETAWEAIDRATRARALLAVASGDGNLALIRARIDPEGTTPPVKIILGSAKGNALRASGTFDAHERHSRYRLLAQQGGAFGAPEDRAHVVAEAADPGVRRYRPLTLVARDQLDAAAALAQVRWEANVRRGRALRASYTLVGWRDDLGRLWRPNTRVRVEDPWLAIDHELLVASVRLSIHPEEGILTDLELVESMAYLPEPAQPEPSEATRQSNVAQKTAAKNGGGDAAGEPAEIGWLSRD